MNVWSILMLVLLAGGVGIGLAKDGEPRTGKWSFWVSLTRAVIQAAILYMAGLWD